jgi:hypothetical protein
MFRIFKAILRVLSNPAVLALLKIIWLLLKLQSNNEVLRDLTIPVMSLKIFYVEKNKGLGVINFYLFLSSVNFLGNNKITMIALDLINLNNNLFCSI